ARAPLVRASSGGRCGGLPRRGPVALAQDRRAVPPRSRLSPSPRARRALLSSGTLPRRRAGVPRPSRKLAGRPVRFAGAELFGRGVAQGGGTLTARATHPAGTTR